MIPTCPSLARLWMRCLVLFKITLPSIRLLHSHHSALKALQAAMRLHTVQTLVVTRLHQIFSCLHPGWINRMFSGCYTVSKKRKALFKRRKQGLEKITAGSLDKHNCSLSQKYFWVKFDLILQHAFVLVWAFFRLRGISLYLIFTKIWVMFRKKDPERLPLLLEGRNTYTTAGR